MFYGDMFDGRPQLDPNERRNAIRRRRVDELRRGLMLSVCCVRIGTQ